MGAGLPSSMVELLPILKACGWPRVSFGRRVIAGEPAWRAVTLTPAEARAVLARLGRRELLLLGAGRCRLRAWLDAQADRPGPVETRAERAARLAREVRLYGDDALLPLVSAALATVPRPVADLVTSTCMVLATGRSTAGWTTGPLPPLRPIMLSGHLPDREVVATLLHEVGHAWTLPAPEQARAAPEILAAARWLEANGTLAAAQDRIDLGEWQADTLAAAWLACA